MTTASTGDGATKRKGSHGTGHTMPHGLWNAGLQGCLFPCARLWHRLRRGRLAGTWPTGPPSSDLDLVIIYEPRTLNDQQLNGWPANSGTPYGTAVWTSTTPSARAPNAKSPTMTFPPPWAGWT